MNLIDFAYKLNLSQFNQFKATTLKQLYSILS